MYFIHNSYMRVYIYTKIQNTVDILMFFLSFICAFCAFFLFLFCLFYAPNISRAIITFALFLAPRLISCPEPLGLPNAMGWIGSLVPKSTVQDAGLLSYCQTEQHTREQCLRAVMLSTNARQLCFALHQTHQQSLAST